MNHDAERKVYDLLDEKLGEFHYDGIPDAEFHRRWDEYLASIGVKWSENPTMTIKQGYEYGEWRVPIPLPEVQDGLTLHDPLYTRGGIIRLDEDLVRKILVFGLP
jgi:hypothetical protein